MLTAARDPEGRPTTYDRLPESLPRLMPIGRLDMGSEGLLLLTNDGELKRRLELPATGWLRRYRVRVHGRIDEGKLEGLQNGIVIDGFQYGPIQARLDQVQGSNAWHDRLARRQEREIRRVLEHFGWPVNRLIRPSFGPFQLGGWLWARLKRSRPRCSRISSAAPSAARRARTGQRTVNRGRLETSAMVATRRGSAWRDG